MSDVPLPVVLRVGETRATKIGSEDIIVVGSAPSGYAVLLSPEDWTTLQRWNLASLRIQRGQVHAHDGRSGRMVARFLTGTDNDRTRAVRYRNRCALDLRRSNIVVVPYSLVHHARRAAPGDANEPQPTVIDRNGTVRPSRKHRWPRASQRLEQLIRGPRG